MAKPKKEPKTFLGIAKDIEYYFRNLPAITEEDEAKRIEDTLNIVACVMREHIRFMRRA
jgi:hypothetical protein